LIWVTARTSLGTTELGLHVHAIQEETTTQPGIKYNVELHYSVKIPSRSSEQTESQCLLFNETDMQIDHEADEKPLTQTVC